jgi:hypothetical protein
MAGTGKKKREETKIKTQGKECGMVLLGTHDLNNVRGN